MSEYTITNWDYYGNVRRTNSSLGYLAPECLVVRISGFCETRNVPITHTGEIVEIGPGFVRTLSGSTYRLGTPASSGAMARLLYAWHQAKGHEGRRERIYSYAA